jgi:hypothetical protein
MCGEVLYFLPYVIIQYLRERAHDNIKMDRQEVGCGCIDWIELAQDRHKWRTVVNAVMNLRVP